VLRIFRQTNDLNCVFFITNACFRIEPTVTKVYDHQVSREKNINPDSSHSDDFQKGTMDLVKKKKVASLRRRTIDGAKLILIAIEHTLKKYK